MSAKDSKKLSTDAFVDVIRKSKLVEGDDLKEAVQLVAKAAGGKLPQDPMIIAERLLIDGHLTAWQIEKLLTGKYKGFFLGKFKLLGHIGSGGMSSVYLAEHTRMRDLRAIKVLPKKRINDATYLARFQLEAKAIASLNHENIVRAYDIDNDGDLHYIVMEYVAGDDLQQIVKRKGPMPFDKAADFIAQAARGLQHAHDRGMIHRDVKPANLLVNGEGQIKLLDMGLALLDSEEDNSLTVANNENVLGTADYLAPEQALNSHTVDHRADIYGLGCTLYFLLTGRPPFKDGTLAQRIVKHQTEMPEEVRSIRADCPGELEGICTKMLQKEPKYRYKTATSVAEVLESWLSRVRSTSRVSVGGGNGSSSGSDIDLGSGVRRGSDIGIGGSADTISNKDGDTQGGSQVFSDNLSPSDSGRLIKSRPRKQSPGSSIGGSAIDLQTESGYKIPKKAAEKMERTQKRKVVPLAGSAAAKANANSQVISLAQSVGETHPGLAKSRKQEEFTRKIKTFLLIILAGIVCFFAGKLAGPSNNQPPPPNPPAESESEESGDDSEDSTPLTADSRGLLNNSSE